MAQQTLVLRLEEPARAAFRRRLGEGDFEYRTVPHAVLSVKGEGVVATLYSSGKLVVQGESPELFVARFAPDARIAGDASATQKCAPPPSEFDRPTAGSDESGKGDYFGPLVCAAVRLEPPQAAALIDAGVKDSKRLSDARALRVGAWLRQETRHAVRSLEPVAYNRAWQEQGLHTLLSELHVAALREVIERGDRVVVDQFARRDEIGPALADLEVELELRPRAESELAVAAASILARSEFLIALEELSQRAGVALPKGAGAAVDQAGVALYRAHGEAGLRHAAKLHFKNTQKIHALL